MALSNTPTFAEVLNWYKERVVRDVRVAIPATVQRYDASKQVIDAAPQIKDLYEAADGTMQPLELPVVCNVKVLFPRAGGFSIVLPISVGDPVQLLINDRSIDAWQSNGGLQSPSDARRHDLSDAVAVLGMFPDNAALSDVDTSVITIGKDGETANFAALANLVNQQLQALASVFSAWTPVPNDGGTALKTALTALISGPPSWPADVSSATVKIKG